MNKNKYPLDIIIILGITVLTIIAFIVLQNEQEIEYSFASEENGEVQGAFSYRNFVESELKIEIESEIYIAEFVENTSINKGNFLSDYGIDVFDNNNFESPYILFEEGEYFLINFYNDEKGLFNVIFNSQLDGIVKINISNESFTFSKGEEIEIKDLELESGQQPLKFFVEEGEVKLDSIEIKESTLPKVKKVNTLPKF